MAKKSLYEPLLAEVAWEVCNQIGGIYTVVRSKAPYISENGVNNTASLVHCWMTGFRQNLKKQLIPIPMILIQRPWISCVQTGWKFSSADGLPQGTPKVVLMRPEQANDQMKDIRQYLLKHHHINIFNPDDLLQQVITFGHLVYSFLLPLKKSQAVETSLGIFTNG